MTSGGYDPNEDHKADPPVDQGGFPPPASYPPPGSYPPPFQGAPQYQQPGDYGPAGPTNPGFPIQDGVPPTQLLPLRLGARFIDGIIVGIVASILVAVFATIGDVAITAVLVGIIGFAYFVAMETTQGATVGKRVLGLSVRGPGDAPRVTLQQAAVRNAFLLLGIIPVVGSLVLFIAYVVIAVTINNSPTAQGKHDSLAGGTQVVKNR